MMFFLVGLHNRKRRSHEVQVVLLLKVLVDRDNLRLASLSILDPLKFGSARVGSVPTRNLKDLSLER